jgi:hypothetical protein
MAYEAIQTMPQRGGYFIREAETNRLLAGIGNNHERAWVYPLHSPKGHNVVQEFPFDHPFHNGVFVGQGKVIHNDKLWNFWAPMKDWRESHNPIFQHMGKIRYGHQRPEPEILADGVRVTYDTTWGDENFFPILEEKRTYGIREVEDAVLCDVVSAKTAAHGALRFDQSKHGSIGARVHPELLPSMGGKIIVGNDDDWQEGKENIVGDGHWNFAAYETKLASGCVFGICLQVIENSAAKDSETALCGPWFLRNYGMAMFNATKSAAIDLETGETWTCGLRVAAYGGPLTRDRTQAWRSA